MNNKDPQTITLRQPTKNQVVIHQWVSIDSLGTTELGYGRGLLQIPSTILLLDTCTQQHQ